MRRNATGVLLAVTGAALLTAPASAGSADYDLPRVTVSSHGVTVEATRGTGCSVRREPDGRASGMCADFGYPLPKKGSVPVHPNGQVLIEVDVAVEKLSADLRDAQSRSIARIAAVALDDSRRRFQVTLPPGPPAATLGIQLDWKSADGCCEGNNDYEAAMHEHQHPQLDTRRRAELGTRRAAEAAARRAASRQAERMGIGFRPRDFGVRCKSSAEWWRCSVRSRGGQCRGTLQLHPRRPGLTARRVRVGCGE